MKNKLKVGFIGLGLMGNPMAKNILKSGFSLSVYNRSKERTKEFKKLGAEIYDSPKELAENVDVIVSMITGPKDVEDVFLGKSGVAKGAKKGLIAIDMSTIGPAAAKNIYKNLQKQEISFLDAPVTGSVIRAVSGELTIFIGGEEETFEKVKSILKTMGKDLYYMGSSGSGQAIKLVNNHLVASTVTALAEGMLLTDLLGLSRKKAAEALENVPALSPFMKIKLPNMINNKFPVAFSVVNMKKDLTLALNETKNKKINLRLLSFVQKLFKKGLSMNLDNEDISAILKVIEKGVLKS